MPSFKKINTIDEINLSNNWVYSTKFNDKIRILDENGKLVGSTSNYDGRRYRLIAKERAFSRTERAERGFLGVAAVVFSLGIALLFSSVRNLLTKEKEKIRFGVLISSSSVGSSQGNRKKSDPNNKIEDSICKQELQEGISISEVTKENIRDLWTTIRGIKGGEKKNGVTGYTCNDSHRVFELDTAPGYIFKLKICEKSISEAWDDSIKARYRRMVVGKRVCRIHKLGQLVIPNAKLFTVTVEGNEYDIIAEKKLDIDHHESMQEEYYEEYAPSLDKAIHDLAVFICETGYSDVECRNNPVLNKSLDKKGLRKIALIDIEEMEGSEAGLFGCPFAFWERRGWVRCVNEEQGRIVVEVAKQHGVSTSSEFHSYEDAYDKRKKQLEERREIKEFHKEKGITTGKEPIEVDNMDSLGLNLTEEAQIIDRVEEGGKPIDKERIVTLEEVTRNVISVINLSIQNSEDGESVKAKRKIELDTKQDLLEKYQDLGLPSGESGREAQKKLWLYRIVQSLKDKRHLLKFKFSGYQFSIQA
ncbi:MAG: hypothetical protein K940chlam7_01936 [Chlamydiae bacterium]|nr:hypothetical protein [Chlamydiota bacterium]